MIEDRHKRKFLDFIFSQIKNIQNPEILEFGVSERAMSTSFFLNLCEKNNGNLTSIDINDYSKKFNSPRWNFINVKDDSYEDIDKHLKKDLDVIYLDTTHKADHVEKIIYHYYNKLKVRGLFFIDDISWLPYTKKREKNNFSQELNNQETFERILEIYNFNSKKFDLEFSFVGTGIAKLIRLNNEELSIRNKLYSRKHSAKNFLRKILKFLGIKNKK